MTPCRIRPATEADVDTLVAFTIRQAREAEGVELRVDEVTAGVRGAFRTPPLSTYWVAEDPSGAIVANTSVVTVFIEPAHRGSGLLRQIIDCLAARAREAGALQLRLYAHRSNERAIRAYRRCGFEEAPYVMMTLSKASGPDDRDA